MIFIHVNAQGSLDNLIGQNVIGFEPIRVTKIGITRLTYVILKCFLCPQNVNLPILFGFIQQILKIVVHSENKIAMGIYEWELQFVAWSLRLGPCRLWPRPKPVIKLR